MTSNIRNQDSPGEKIPRSSDSAFVLQRVFNDFDALAETVQGWNLDWIQLDRGPLQAEVVQVVHPGALITHVCFNRQYLQRGSPPAGFRTFGLIDEGSRGVRWCRSAATDRQLLAFNPESDYEAISMPGFGGITISISEELLAGAAADLELRHLDARLTRAERPLHCSPATRKALRGQIGALLDRLSTAPGSVRDRTVQQQIESDLPALLLDLVSPETEPPSPPRPHRRQEAFRLGRAFIEEHAAEAPTIREVCRAAGVSWRTLDYAFREYLGVSPKAYLQAVRLARFRQELRRGADIKISQLAGRWGFWHMGQLAADYRRQFAERPSETLRRSSRG